MHTLNGSLFRKTKKLPRRKFIGVDWRDNERGKSYPSIADAMRGARSINDMLGAYEKEGFSICSIYQHKGLWYLSRYYPEYSIKVKKQ